MDIFPPYLNAILAGVFGLLLFSFYILKRSKDANTKLPPEAGGSWPIIGHLHLLSGGSQLMPHITLGNMADKYGPIFTIRIGIHKVVLVSSSEIAKEIFTTHDAAVASRPKLVASKLLGYNYAMFGFSLDSAYWREIRKIVTLELLSNRRLELLKHVRASEVESSIKELHKLWSQKKDGSGRVLVEMKQWFGDLAHNIIIRMVVGKRYFGAFVESDEKEAQKCQKVIRRFFTLLGLLVVRDALPFLGWLDIGGYEKAMKKTANELDSLADKWLTEHRQKRAFGDTKGEPDFMDAMLSILDDKSYSSYNSDTIIKATSMAMITGASDTTIVSLTWALSLLLNNRHVLKKAQEELDFHIGRKRLVEESDISNLVYLQAIFKETLRLHPPGPLSAHRQFIKNCTIGGYHVPKGTWLITNLWKIQHDPHTWPDPHEFKPERFLTTHKDVDVRGHHFELIPFGSGRRACPGTSFGLQVVHLVLANLLHAFDIWNPSDARVDMTEIFGMTNIKATPLEVLLTPRLSPSLFTSEEN